VHDLNVVLEMIDVVKNHTLRLTQRMMTDDLLVWALILQVNVFHVVHHVGDAAKGASTILIRVLFVANKDYALSLLENEGKLITE
jgi:hypothetical protein